MQRFAAALSVLVLSVGAASAAPAQLTVVNGTHFAIFAVQERPAGGPGWHGDLLSQKTLKVGGIRAVALPAGTPCSVDMLATLDDGHKVLMRRVNICNRAALAVTDDRH